MPSATTFASRLRHPYNETIVNLGIAGPAIMTAFISRITRLFAVAIPLLIALLAAEPAAADKRVALVIGNASYQHAAALAGASEESPALSGLAQLIQRK